MSLAKKGQTALEYMLLLVIILIVVIALMIFMQGSANVQTNSTTCSINKLTCSLQICGNDTDCRVSGGTLNMCGTYGYCDCMGKCVASCNFAVTPPVCGPVPVNGVCGTLNNCTNGTFKDTPDDLTYYRWNCTGSNGGTNATCNLSIPVATPVCYLATLGVCTVDPDNVPAGETGCSCTNNALAAPECNEVRLTGDISISIPTSDGVNCIHMVDHKTLDCQGYNIRRTGGVPKGAGSVSSGILAQALYTSINDCYINNFDSGIVIAGDYVNVSNVVSTNNNEGLSIISGHGHNIISDSIFSNNWRGIYHQGVPNTTYQNLQVTSNAQGILISNPSGINGLGVTVTGSTICNNLGDIITSSGLTADDLDTSSNYCSTLGIGAVWHDSDSPLPSQPCKNICSGAATCECDSCATCTAKLADPACTTVTLVGDIPLASNECIEISSNNKTFDCQNHQISMSSSGTAVVLLSGTGSEVKNCNIAISNSSGGIMSSGSNNRIKDNAIQCTASATGGISCSSGNTVQGNTITNCLSGISISGNGGTITGNTIDNAATGGGSISSSANSVTITGNTIDSAAACAINVGYNINGNTVSSNTVTNSKMDGICVMSNQHTITGNTVTNSGISGLVVASDSNTISGNTISGSNPGFYLASSTDPAIGLPDHNVITGNTVCSNPGGDIHYPSSASTVNTIYSNTCNTGTTFDSDAPTGQVCKNTCAIVITGEYSRVYNSGSTKNNAIGFCLTNDPGLSDATYTSPGTLTISTSGLHTYFDGVYPVYKYYNTWNGAAGFYDIPKWCFIVKDPEVSPPSCEGGVSDYYTGPYQPGPVHGTYQFSS